MANITMSLDADLIKKVRKLAIERNTTLTALVREYLRRLAAREDERTEEIIDRLLDSWNTPGIVVGPQTWAREDLHER